MIKTNDRERTSPLPDILLVLTAAACLLPLIVALSSSFSDEADIVKNGYCIVPRLFSTETYRFLLSSKTKILLRSYANTILVVCAGTLYTMTITVCYAYAIAQKRRVFPLGQALSFFAWFTTVFGGGVLPWYILCTRYYGLHNNLWALFIPYGMNVFNMFILRSSFKALPEELTEAARIDGAANLQIFLRIALPLAKSSLVTVTLFTVLAYWNDFTLPLYLVTTNENYTIQKLLYNMMANITALLSGRGSNITTHMVLPSNTARMAMTVLTVLPIAVIFPFAQKFFVKGITVGAVKG